MPSGDCTLLRSRGGVGRGGHFPKGTSAHFLSIILSISIFFLCVICSLRVNTVAIILILTSIVLLSLSVFSFFKNIDLKSHSASLHTELQNIFVNKANSGFWLFMGISALMMLLALLVSVSFNFCAKYLCSANYASHWLELLEESTKNIEEAIRKVLQVKLVLLVPFCSLLLKALLIFLTMHSLSLLASPNVQEFRVAGACPEELCINDNTNKFYREGDLCAPDHFK